MNFFVVLAKVYAMQANFETNLDNVSEQIFR